MAEILLTAVINKSVEIGGNLLFQAGRRLYWLKENIDWLKREMRHIRSYIDNAKDRAVGGDSTVKTLIKDIQELAGDVEDLLDEFLPKIQKCYKCKGSIGCIKMAFLPWHAHKFAMEIEKIKIRVKDIECVRKTYNFIETSKNNDCISLDQRRVFLLDDETEVIGLDDDFNMLRDKLLDQDLGYGVISIVGIPGVGKTTLGKKLYWHVRDQFECSALVYVSQQPRAREILRDIAEQVGVMEEGRKHNLENNLLSLLKRKRYVILLDDIWDVEIWDVLKHVLNLSIGSKIIITSQNSNVGRYIGGGSSLHELQPLDSEKSFQLFAKEIFKFDNNNWANIASPDLENIGRSIVGRCGGIPLAIVVTAGMLRERGRKEDEWKRLLESMGDHEIPDKCAKVLALSYNDLPTARRPCFLYFGLYPEDHEIRAFDLKNMWIAEKLIEVNSGNGHKVEDLAEDVLNNLVSRNLIQVAKRTYDGRISSCRIHDLLHSLCVRLGEESNFFHTKHDAFDDPHNVARLRRITFYSDNAMSKFFSSNPNTKKLRAVFCFTKDLCIFSQMAHLDFKLLRVLVVVMRTDFCNVTIPNKMGNMSCLRYLRLEGLIFGKLPNSIVKLERLETLDVGKSHIRLPSGVWKSKQLRHLRYGDFTDNMYSGHKWGPNNMYSGHKWGPNNMYSLPNNLQTLMWMSDKFFQPRLLHNLRKLGIREVSDSTIKILSGSSPVPTMLEVLKLDCYNHTSDQSEQINLSSYQNIVKLYLSDVVTMPNNSESFPPNLVKLTLSGLMVDGHLLAVLKKLPKLRVLKMALCIFGEEIMDLSGDANGDSFPQLEVLHIEDPLRLSEVTCTDDVSLPKLNKVLLKNPRVRLSERLAQLRI